MGKIDSNEIKQAFKLLKEDKSERKILVFKKRREEYGKPDQNYPRSDERAC